MKTFLHSFFFLLLNTAFFQTGFSQSVGIGSVQFVPVSMLDVRGSVTIGATYAAVNAAPANGLLVEGSVGIGTTTAAGLLDVGGSSTAGYLFVVPRKTNAGDPAGVAGGVYYNTTTNKFRAYENGAWTDIVSAGSSKWTLSGSDIYRASHVAIGQTTPGTYAALDVNDTSSIRIGDAYLSSGSHGTTTPLIMDLATNGRYNGTNWRFPRDGVAGAIYQIYGTDHWWWTHDGVNAGPCFTQLMHLNAATGHVMIGNSGACAGSADPSYRLDVQGGDVNTSAAYRIDGAVMLNNLGDPSNVQAGYTNNSVMTGIYNVTVGYLAGAINNAGQFNTFVGAQAGNVNVAGNNNTFVGLNAGALNTVSDNTFLGYTAGAGNTTGTPQTFIGTGAGYTTNSGNDNMAVGYHALYLNQTGVQNTAVGHNAGYNNLADNNTFIGWNSGYNTTGSASANGTLNLFVGFQAGYNNTTGSRNTCFGVQTLANFVPTAVTSIENTLIGYQSGRFITTGAGGNVFLGYQTGTAGFGTAVAVSTGTYNTLLGYQANTSNATLTNATAIGYQAIVDGSNKMVFGGVYNAGNETMVGIGTSNPTSRLDVQEDVSLGYAASFFNDGNNADRYGIKIQGGADAGTGTTYYVRCYDGDGTEVGGIRNVAGAFAAYDPSDRRTKTDIVNTKLNGLNIVNNLRVVDYKRIGNPDNTHHGFIAQEVQEVFPYMVTANENGMLSISKELLVPVLVKALQQQQQMIDELKKDNADFKAAMEALTAKMALLEKYVNALKAEGTATGQK